ncbi:MAG: 50S ribosomal protein L17 [Bacteroidota bacterium]|jgi:large subunit ribosomal protein L17|nr:50S ribosomal protein L17 [Algoriphagus sp.]
MRHGKKINHLGRTASHRKAMLSNMASSLILHKRISTTLAKAKELKKFVEPLVTRAKEDTTHNRRIAFSYLKSKEAIKELFGEVVEKVGTRPGGYTRIIKTGFRLGDNAEMCIIELVDFNELMLKDAKPAKKTTRRSRRSSGTTPSTPAAVTAKAPAVEEAPVAAEEAVEDAVEEEVTPVAEVVEEAETPVAEATSEESETPEASADEETEEK